MKANLRLRNYLKFPVVKLIVSQIAYKSLKTAKMPILSKKLVTYDMEKPFWLYNNVESVSNMSQWV